MAAYVKQKPASYIFAIIFCVIIAAQCIEDDSFTEELYISSLNGGHVLSHFQFTTVWNSTITNPNTCKKWAEAIVTDTV